LSSASPPCNFLSDLRLISAAAPHESTSPASNLARASARTLVLCLPFLRTQFGGAPQTLRRAALRPFSLPPATETEAHRPQDPHRKRQRPPHRETNPIVPRGGFLQAAVSEAPVHSVSTPSSSLRGRFRYSTKTYGKVEILVTLRSGLQTSLNLEAIVRGEVQHY
jgi:hypothetical protein